jgi:hypothetical protein
MNTGKRVLNRYHMITKKVPIDAGTFHFFCQNNLFQDDTPGLRQLIMR